MVHRNPSTCGRIPQDYLGELSAVFSSLDDSALLVRLQEYRPTGRQGYPLKALWRAYVGSFVLNLAHTNALIRRLEDDADFRTLCGFGDLPHRRTFNRFIRRQKLLFKGDCNYMKGVILAAGYGRRFAPGEGFLHKLLLRIGNRAVIDYTLEAFGKAGISDVAMVVGHRAELLRGYNGDGACHGIHLEYLFNPQYERGNALSLSLSLNTAKSFTQEEPFLLSMGDHLVSAELLSRILVSATDSSAVAVDFSPDIHDIEEATRVRVDSEGCINP